jgi:hypothetical protein
VSKLGYRLQMGDFSGCGPSFGTPHAWQLLATPLRDPDPPYSPFLTTVFDIVNGR